MIAFVCTALSAFRPTHELWQRRSAYKSRVDERQFTTFAAARKPPIMIVTEVYGSPARSQTRARTEAPRAETGLSQVRPGQRLPGTHREEVWPISVHWMVPSASPYGVGVPKGDLLTRLNTRPAHSLVNASTPPSRRPRVTQGRCGSLLHIRMTLSFATPRRFNRRTRRNQCSDLKSKTSARRPRTLACKAQYHSGDILQFDQDSSPPMTFSRNPHKAHVNSGEESVRLCLLVLRFSR
jgi:hypothetical protein